MINGQKTVIESEIDPLFPSDTVNTFFTYNQQGQLTDIKAESFFYTPGAIWSHHKLTWNGNRLTRVVCDTAGAFAHSFDYTYTPSGSNTLISLVEVPSQDVISTNPIFEIRLKYTATVNSQFRLVKEQEINDTYVFQNTLPEHYHDTLDFNYTYAGNDLGSYNIFHSGTDTNSNSSGNPTNFHKDTAISTYSRSAMGANLADSLMKIYGNDIYTMLNSRLLYFYETPDWNFSEGRESKHFYFRPLNTNTQSAKAWENGVFDPANSYTNQLVEKRVNSFDAQGRLIRSDWYGDYGGGLEYIYRFTYY